MATDTKQAKILEFDCRTLKVCPYDQFSEWYELALSIEEITYPHAFTLSTLNPIGYPEGRIVLMKDFEKDRGLTFYTNTLSTKGKSLKTYPRAGCTFFWDSIGKQVRILGDVEQVSEKEADAYFETRIRESQLGAWASNQSLPIANRETLMANFEEYKKLFHNKKIIRPAHWGGYSIKPISFEFWTFGHNRLHQRYKYFNLHEGKWEIETLQP